MTKNKSSGRLTMISRAVGDVREQVILRAHDAFGSPVEPEVYIIVAKIMRVH